MDHVAEDLFRIPRPTREELAIINAKRAAMVRGEIPSTTHGVYRFPRVTCDYTLYSADELVVMEANWDRLIAAYQTRLLPERYRANPAEFSGVNLGTNNGSYQRGWMRLGYRMFGVEFNDLLAELKANHCDGIIGSFFDLHAIESNSFDFGIVDRAMFNCNANEERNSWRCADGTYFSEMRRVIKDDGALCGILYKNWSAEAFAELASLGHLTFYPTVAKAHPFLAFVVDFSRAPVAVPDLELAARALQVSADAQKFNVLNGLFYLLGQGEGRLTALFIPTNEVVDLAYQDGAWAVESHTWWENRKDVFEKNAGPRSITELPVPRRRAAAPKPVKAPPSPPPSVWRRILPGILGAKRLSATKQRLKALAVR